MNYLKKDIMDIVFKSRSYDSWAIWHHFWMKPGILPQEKKAIYTMWESTQLYPGWKETLNEANMILVPCQQNLETFKANGVKTPIHVVQHGVDQEFYYYRPKIKSDIFTFFPINISSLKYKNFSDNPGIRCKFASIA